MTASARWRGRRQKSLQIIIERAVARFKFNQDRTGYNLSVATAIQSGDVRVNALNFYDPCAQVSNKFLRKALFKYIRKVFFYFMTMPLVMMLSACGGPQHKYNQKIIVEVETPNGVVSGYSVMSLVDKTLPGTGNVSTKIKGEGVVVNISSGKYLFLLTNLTDSILSNVFKDVRAENFDKRMEIITRMRERREIPTEWRPAFATFTNPSDPATGIMVNPKDFERHFGSGVRLKSVTIEITDEQRTEGNIVKILPWHNRNYIFNELTNEKWKSFSDDIRFIINTLEVNRY